VTCGELRFCVSSGSGVLFRATISSKRRTSSSVDLSGFGEITGVSCGGLLYIGTSGSGVQPRAGNIRCGPCTPLGPGVNEFSTHRFRDMSHRRGGVRCGLRCTPADSDDADSGLELGHGTLADVVGSPADPYDPDDPDAESELEPGTLMLPGISDANLLRPECGP
jgi:hypothetical protein